MRVVVLAVLCILRTGQIFADQVTCGSITVAFSAGGRASCIAPGVNVSSQPIGADARIDLGIVSGQFQVFTFAELDYTTGEFVGPDTTFSASWNDIYRVPASPPSDVFQVSLYIGGLASSGSITVGSNPPYTYVDDIHYYRPTVETVRAAGNGTVELAGNWSYTATNFTCCGGSAENEVAFVTQVNIERFKADGVTPDPFVSVPEPGSLAVAGVGLLLLASISRKRRRHC